jgi:hypothetical protein
VSSSPAASSPHEATTKLAYECWECRGRPFGSPEVDWSAAEKVLASSPIDNQQDFSVCSFQLEANEGAHR